MRRLLDQLKEEYQQKIQDLEQRLAALEQQNSRVVVPDEGGSRPSVGQIVPSASTIEKAALTPPPTFQGSCRASLPTNSCRKRKPKSRTWSGRPRVLNFTDICAPDMDSTVKAARW